MIKLLVVDDEQIVIDSLKYLVDKFIDGATVIGTARTGREAIEKALDLKPDAMLVDIRMPGINGIEAISQIKAENSNIIFVIITAHEYFDYAKEAINLGVYEYLLKPLNKEKVIETIKSIIIKIDSRKEEIKRELLLKEKINKLTPLLEGQLVYSLLINPSIIQDISFYEEVFGMSLGNGYIITAVVNEIENQSKEETLKSSILKQKFYDSFSMELKRELICLLGPPLLDRIVAYVPMDEEIYSYNSRNQIIELTQTVAKRIERNIRINYRIGVGRSYSIDNFSKSYNEAIIAATVPSGDRVTHFEDIALSLNKPDSYSTSKEQLLIDKLLAENSTGTLEVFNEMFLGVAANYENDLDQIKSKLIELLIVLRRAIPYQISNTSISEQSFLKRLLKINNLRELKLDYIDYLNKLAATIKQYREKELKGLISEAINFISNNYQNNISLDEVAKEINMSYHYFSKFFKDSIGKNFVDYLTDLRIEKSKELLKGELVSVKEVCYQVGYSDPNYFSKIFKKTTGTTPTEYRENKFSGKVI